MSNLTISSGYFHSPFVHQLSPFRHFCFVLVTSDIQTKAQQETKRKGGVMIFMINHNYIGIVVIGNVVDTEPDIQLVPCFHASNSHFRKKSRIY